MKLKLLLPLLFIVSIASAQSSKGYYAGGVTNTGQAFAVVGLHLNETTSAYSNIGIAGTMTVGAGVVHTVLNVNDRFKVGALGEAGAAVSGGTGFAGALGGVVSYSIDRWLPGASIFGVMKFAKAGETAGQGYGFGLSKSF